LLSRLISSGFIFFFTLFISYFFLLSLSFFILSVYFIVPFFILHFAFILVSFFLSMFNSFGFHFYHSSFFLQYYTLSFFCYNLLNNSSGPSLLSFMSFVFHQFTHNCLFPFLVISSFLFLGLPTSWCRRGVAQSEWGWPERRRLCFMWWQKLARWWHPLPRGMQPRRALRGGEESCGRRLTTQSYPVTVPPHLRPLRGGVLMWPSSSSVIHLLR
jgi:hypothetical protein